MIKKFLNPLFVLHLIFVGLVLIGRIPRETVIYETGILALYFIFASIEDGLVFFVRSIPLFIATPVTLHYDNLNQWRILAVILFLKWLFQRETFHYIGSMLILFFKKPWAIIREYPLSTLLKVLAWLALFSLWHAPDKAEGFKRIVYFLNAGLIGVVITFPPRGKIYIERLIKNITAPVIIVTLVGVIQVISTYLIDIYQFMRIWGEGIQLREFGTTWSYIAVHVGNTWFAYFGNQLSLRVFSLFPDSHSFPIFLLLGLPAIFAWSVHKPIENSSSLKAMFNTRGKLLVLFIPLAYLLMILSGTRGIWAGGIAMIIWAIILMIYMESTKVAQDKKNIFTYLSSYLVIFFMLFAVAYPIFSSPQFLVSKGDSLLLEQRLKSILDFEETSNSQRIEIWKKSLVSIGRHPILGIGIANFPIVLNQNIILAKAGSSAHNIYLHIAAEMGLPALIIFLGLLLIILRQIYKQFINAKEPHLQAYFGSLLITFPWVLAYLMTDVAIFDERALLLCVFTISIVATHPRSHV